MEREYVYMLEVTNMKENGEIIKRMEMEYNNIIVVTNMMESGKMVK
jgi:hypothetical protein